MSPDPESDLAKVRALCMALPEAAEKVSHGAPTFHIEKGKVFAYFSHNHHGDDRTAVQVKTSGREEQAMLVEMDPDHYYVPSYTGPAGWIGMRLDTGDTDWDHIGDRIATSWELVAPRRLLEAGGR
jgi:phosphoribosylglycinamide formyltransferase-1/phosphoribosylamine--glycine ligase/phosphoribosylglycinamide formyltransferase/phosphoribosylformylglycinamidine cyclo-ligase